MASSVNAGANEVKRANFISKLEQWKAMHESGWSVVMSQRRDVGSTNEKKSTSSNVATSQRRDVSTS